MSATEVVPADEPETARPDLVRVILRLILSIALAAAIGALVWVRRPTQLSPHTDIVGYPTFYDFDFPKAFLAYRLAVWEFPVLTAVFYALLRWRGPLRSRPRAQVAVRRPELIDPVPSEDASHIEMHPLARLVQVFPPAAVVILAASSRPADLGVTVSGSAIAAGLVYIVVVLSLAALLAALSARRGSTWLTGDPGATLSVVNGFAGAVVGVASVAFVSRHTLVISADGSRKYWPWFPLWLAAIMLVALLAWMIWRLRAGWRPNKIERRVRTYVLGSAAVYLVTFVLPGATGPLQGFDDSQSFTGADLMTRGYFPWRDFLFIHGLFEDGLRSSIGFAMFQHSIWGAAAGTFLIVGPLCWVAYYLLGAWAARRGSLVVLGVIAVATWGGIPESFRFVALPVVFVLLGEALRRPRAVWMILFTCAMFIEAVLVPETSFQVIAAVVAIVGCDMVHRDPSRSWWMALSRTRVFLATGVVLSIALGAFLAANRALGAFIDYFRIFGPGHDAAGAIPPHGIHTSAYVMFFITDGLVVLTIWTVAWRLLGRRAWTARDWVTVAAAILAGLYQEKALGRFDPGHILQATAVALPLWIMWTATAVGAADAFLNSQLRRVSTLRPVGRLLRQPIAVLALAAALVGVSHIDSTIWHSPANSRQAVPNLTDVPLVGYNTPGSIDPKLVSDLRTVIDTYAGSTGPIFDNTNSLGYYYYLLQRAPASSFLHVSMAQPEYAQGLVIDQLKKSKPSLVAFDETSFGLPAWDGPRNNVRHFEVAQYLLNGWTPIIRTHTVLFMLRNDLVPTMPALPSLTTPPQTSGLYFSNPVCDWGDTPNFLDSSPSGAQLTLPVTSMGSVEKVDVTGWAYDLVADAPATKILVTVGSSVAGELAATANRPDVAAALKDPGATASGFSATVSSTSSGASGVYALMSDGMAHRMVGTGDPSIQSLTRSDGSTVPVSATPATGSVDSIAASQGALGSITLPASDDASAFELANFSAPSTIGISRFDVTDEAPEAVSTNEGGGSQDITAQALPSSGSTFAVRVGSCLQWHGYTGKKIYVLQSGGTPVTRVTLSGVKA